jgi:hypothetical protein
LELGGSQFPALEYIESLGAVGCIVHLHRERNRKNALILLEVQDKEEGLTPRDISDFAKALGTK